MRKNAGKGSFVAPRNGHVAVVMTMRGAGTHQKTKKAMRRLDKVRIMRLPRDPSPAMRSHHRGGLPGSILKCLFSG